MQRIAVEAAIEHRETGEAMVVILERRVNDIDMDTFLAVAQFYVRQNQPATGILSNCDHLFGVY
jgi:hypothetical protein